MVALINHLLTYLLRTMAEQIATCAQLFVY